MSERKERRRYRHAFVTMSGYDVPLIGVPLDAVEETCDKCKESFRIDEMIFGGNNYICKGCSQPK